MTRPINLILIFCFFFIFLFNIQSFPEIKKSEIPFSDKKIRLSWEPVEGAITYQVLIKDTKNNVILDKIVDTNSIITEIPVGKYKIRIGTLNKFNKVGSWSDWAEISIEQPKAIAKEEKKEKKEKEKERKIPPKKDLFNLGLKFSAGTSYFYILPVWDEYYDNSFKGISINAAYSFRYMRYANILGILKYLGLEFESTYIKFNGIKAFNRIESDLDNLIAGGNILLYTNFNFPLNFSLRGGGGLVYTRMDFQKYDDFNNPVAKDTEYSIDYFYKAGISIEYRFYSVFFVEAFADYYSIQYLAKAFNTLRFSCLAGVRF